MARLRSDFWVSAYLRLCATEGIAAALRRRGHGEAGEVFVKADHLDQSATLYGPAPLALMDDTGERRFYRIMGPAFSGDIEQRIAKELKFDPDLWLVEVDVRGELTNLPLVSL